MIYKRWPVDVMELKHSEVKKMEEDATAAIAKEMGIDPERKEVKDRFWVWRLETFGKYKSLDEIAQTMDNEYGPYEGPVTPLPPGYKLPNYKDN